MEDRNFEKYEAILNLYEQDTCTGKINMRFIIDSGVECFDLKTNYTVSFEKLANGSISANFRRAHS